MKGERWKVKGETCPLGFAIQGVLRQGFITRYNHLGSQTLTLKSIGLQIRLDGILNFKVKHKDLSPPMFIEEVAQAKRCDGGVKVPAQ